MATETKQNGYHDAAEMNGDVISDEWNTIAASEMAKRAVNPIRKIVDTMRIKPNPKYKHISLGLGDPTAYGNLRPHPVMMEAVNECVTSEKHNGYYPAVGYLEAKKVIASYMTRPEAPLTDEDIIITSACSGALDMCISSLANPGDNILYPKPGFPLYRVVCNSNGCELRSYNLLPDLDWEIDLKQMESLIDERTKCIIVNNPSNPCGSVYSREHLLEIIKIAEKHKIPILADEIYAYCTFSDVKFHPMATLTKTVPILSCCALSKRFLVPGWRLGWIQIHDRNDLLKEIRAGLINMATRLFGANSLVQGALPRILNEIPQEWFEGNMKIIEEIGYAVYDGLSKIRGLKPIKPKGAMYMMIGIDKTILKTIKDDVHFTESLMAKKSVFCVPGSCFEIPDYFRIVLTFPVSLAEEVCSRMQEYCNELIEDAKNLPSE